jgi:hypothetical protein
MKKSQDMRGSVGPAFFSKVLRLVKAQKSLTPGLDWPYSFVDPNGLLSVVSHMFAVPVIVLWVGLEKKRYS